MRYFLIFLMWVMSMSVQAGQDGQFQSFEHLAQDGVKRPYIVYIPSTIDQDKKSPLLVYLHGAISTPTIRENPLESLKKSSYLALAEQCACYALFPYGQKGATWFDEVGVNMVMAEIDKVVESFSVDRDKIFLSGFSDGGSGTLYIASTDPSRFAGFIAMNGSYSVAAYLGEKRVYPENLANRPVYVINTQSDSLYPAKMMNPLNLYVKQFAKDFTLVEPEGEHTMSYLPEELPNLVKFIQSHKRPKASEQTLLSWETSQADGIDWLAIEQLDTHQAPKAWHTPYQLKMRHEKASYGIKIDASYAQGLRIGGFSDNSAAQKMGAKVGDIVLKMGDQELQTPYDTYRYLATKKAGQATSLTVKRGDEVLTLNGEFSPPYDYEVFEKTAPSGKVKAHLDQGIWKIETSKVARLRIDGNALANHQEVWVNGKSVKLKAGEANVLSVAP